jgi:hypothetical protein
MTATAPPPVRRRPGYRHIVREIARGGLAGLITGLVMGGGGGRLAMRLAALIDPSARGRTTEAGFSVGELTLGGTVELVLFGGIFTGIGLAIIWVIVRPWLPNRGAVRYLVAALIGVAMGGRFAIDGRNIDFFILDPAWGQVTIFLVLSALTGAAVVAVDGWLERRLPPPRRHLMIGYGIVAAIGLILTIPSLLLYFRADDCACVSPPRLVGVFLVGLALLTARSWFVDDGSYSWIARAGPIVLAGMVIAGLFHLGGEITHFM